MQLIRFGGVDLPMVSEEVTFPFDTRSNLIPLPYGGIDQDGQASVYQANRIGRTFRVPCTENERDLVASTDRLMRAFASGRKVLVARMRDGSYRQTFAKVLNAPQPRRSDDKNYQEFSVVWELDFPYWIDTEQEPHYLDHGLYLDSGLFLDGNYTSVTLNELIETFSIENNGVVQNRRGFLYIYPDVGGAFTDLTLRNLTNDYILYLVGTVVDGQRLLVDFLSKSVKLDAVDAYTMLELPTGQMDWMMLEVGTNYFSIELASVTGNTTFEYHWADLYK